LALTLIGASVLLASALSGSRPGNDVRRSETPPVRSAIGSQRKRSASTPTQTLTQGSKVALPAREAFPVSKKGNRPIVEATVAATPPTGLVRAPLAPRSWLMLGSPNSNDEDKQQSTTLGSLQQDLQADRSQDDNQRRKPKEALLTRARSFDGDLRNLPRRKPVQRERPEIEGPELDPVFAPGTPPTAPSAPEIGGPSAPAPAPLHVFEGLDRFNWGAGSPPDTNGDVGPNHVIQTVNTSIGVFRKSDGFQEAAFTFDTFMSQGNFGNLCDTDNFGDPVVLYDTFEDRWIITDFAFVLDGGGNVVAPAFQCIAA